MSFPIGQLADAIRSVSGEGSVSGVSEHEIEELKSRWGVRELPAAYVEFLRFMGAGAGRLLLGTDAFFPRILQLPTFVAEFQSENNGAWQFPEKSLIFAMHQGYQVYYLEGVDSDDPPVALYMEASSELMRRWESFTAFLDSQFAEDYHRTAE